MTSRTFTTKEVLALLEQQNVFENEEGCVDFNSESDDDGVHLTEGDFTLDMVHSPWLMLTYLPVQAHA